MIKIIFIFAVASIAVRLVPAMLAEIIATIVAVLQTESANRIRQALSDSSSKAVPGTGWDRKPAFADRRLLKRALRSTMRQTQTASLFPHIARRADTIAVALSRASR